MAAGRDDFETARRHMVSQHIAARGIAAPAVLSAMGHVPREQFVPTHLRHAAYNDSPLPIEDNQTISQPFIVAMMAEAAELTPTSRVLEIGTGSGYGAAVLSRCAADVWTIERHEFLATTAQERLAELGYTNVTVLCGDGTLGVPDAAPFDAIVVTAAAPEVPATLVAQLAEGGRLIMPIGPDHWSQELVRLRRVGTELIEEDLGGVRFVPLIADHSP